MPDDIIQTISGNESNYGLPNGLLYRLASLESGLNPSAYNSASGASGITQIIPKFHPTVRNPFDYHEALEYTARRLRGWFDEFNDWQSAVASWHAGETAVRKARANGQAIPGTTDRYTGLPTSSYVSRIVGSANSDIIADHFQPEADLRYLSILGLSPALSILAISAAAGLILYLALDSRD